jgi:precorrin-6A/cobalt-precorrin-6A reductase
MRRGWSSSDVSAVVDATHPIAATITAHAAEVCGDLEIPHLVLARPAWPPRCDRPSMTRSCKALAAQRFSRVFLTTGRPASSGFRVDACFLIRASPRRTRRPCRANDSCCPRGPYRTTTSWRARRTPHRLSGDEEQRRRMTRPKLMPRRTVFSVVMVTGAACRGVAR